MRLGPQSFRPTLSRRTTTSRIDTRSPSASVQAADVPRRTGSSRWSLAFYERAALPAIGWLFSEFLDGWHCSERILDAILQLDLIQKCHAVGEDALGSRHHVRRSAEFLGEPDEKSFGPANVAEPIRVFVLDHFAADKLRAVLTEPGERLVDVVHGEHDA
jgi:hypothetical protein